MYAVRSDWFQGFPDCGGSAQSPINLAASTHTVVEVKRSCYISTYGEKLHIDRCTFARRRRWSRRAGRNKTGLFLDLPCGLSPILVRTNIHPSAVDPVRPPVLPSHVCVERTVLHRQRARVGGEGNVLNCSNVESLQPRRLDGV